MNKIHPDILYSMKAITRTTIGPPTVLTLTQDHPHPILTPHTILIRDCEIRSMKFPPHLRTLLNLIGVFNPKTCPILGQEFSGVICDIGDQVKGWTVGDQVCGSTGDTLGAYAEYVKVEVDHAHHFKSSAMLCKKPVALSMVESSVLPLSAVEALCFVNDLTVLQGQRVLIIGLIAKMVKLAYVVAVDSGEKMGMLKALGADVVLDYTSVDY
ncbi:hypothetical protein BC829DRAFT_393714 [Chytridium lagenaria]|nr:hypothetical protein BC829DRAFT_393714 [Chytridium lagenaria]